MKELANSLAQLVAIIMLLITFAVSSAAISQWASSDSVTRDSAPAKPDILLVSDAR